MFDVYTADLDSLYDDQPRPPVVEATVIDEEKARKTVAELQDHKTAAWFQERVVN